MHVLSHHVRLSISVAVNSVTDNCGWTHNLFSPNARLRNASDCRVLEAVDGQACVQTE